MKHLPHRHPVVDSIVIDNLAVNVLCDHITRPCSAVVIVEIVPVNPVLRLIILKQGVYDALFLRFCEVYRLLCDTAPVVFVLPAEDLKRHNSHLVICEAEDKSQHEEGLCKREHAIVHREIHSAARILYSQGCMAIKAVNLIMRRASEQ